MSSDLCQQAIRELAYQKWEQAGCPLSDGVSFWLEAETELVSCTFDEATPAADCCQESLKIAENEVKPRKKAG